MIVDSFDSARDPLISKCDPDRRVPAYANIEGGISRPELWTIHHPCSFFAELVSVELGKPQLGVAQFVGPKTA